MEITVNSSGESRKVRPKTRFAWWQRIRWSEHLGGYMYLLPALIVFGLFAWYPIVKTVIFSFQNVSLTGESTWVGLDNINRMLADPQFVQAWRNSIVFASLSVEMGFFIPVFVSIMINEMQHAKGFFRLVYFLPSVIPITVSLMIWKIIYSPDNGVLNAVLHLLSIKPQLWLQDPNLIKASIILILTWANFGSTVLIYIAALQDIPTEYYEAAEISGATAFQRIYYITLPHLYPTMVMTFILQIIAVVQIFTEPFLLAPGNPATLTPVLVIFNKAFLYNDFGLASAWSLSLIVILGIGSAIYLRFTRRDLTS